MRDQRAVAARIGFADRLEQPDLARPQRPLRAEIDPRRQPTLLIAPLAPRSRHDSVRQISINAGRATSCGNSRRRDRLARLW
jgi:hypothetical protein